MPELPQVLDGIQARIEHEAMMQEHVRREQYALAYQPAPERFIRDTISHVHWDLAEAGYGTPAQPHAHQALVMVTDHPQLAFQVAHYLHKHGYMQDHHFNQLNREIKAHKQQPAPDAEFRIAIQGSDIARFENEFSYTGDTKPALGKTRLERLCELSEPRSLRTTR